MGGSAHRRRNIPPRILPSVDSTAAATDGVVGADGVDPAAFGALVDGAGVELAFAVSVGEEDGADDDVDGAEGSDVGVAVAAGSEAALGA